MDQELAQVTAVYNTVVTFLVNYSFQAIGAMVVLVIGFIVARKVSNMVLALCLRKKLDVTLSGFIANFVRLLIIVMVAIIALGKLGISITPFVAAVGALSLGAGLAMQGLLSNYGAGLNIIIARPFVVGDTISVQGVTGLVEEIHLAYTILGDEDGVRISIPNKHIVGEIIHNSQADSVLELSVGIAYHCKPETAIAALEKALAELSGISRQRQPMIGIDSFADSSILLGIRLWVRTEVLHETRFQANRVIYNTLKEHHIDIPFPQHEVHIMGQAEAG